MSDLRVVNRNVFEIRTKWKFLGLELNVDPGTLDSLKQTNRGDPNECLYEVLKKWIGKGKACWEQLVMALKEPTVEETGLADSIAREHCQKNESATICRDYPMACEVPSEASTLSPSSSSPLDIIVADTSLVSYVDCLKVEYSKQMLPSEGLLKSQNKICRLAMIKNEEKCLHSNRDEHVRQTITGKVSDILHSRTPVELKDIFDVDRNRQVVLIEGAPGAGKSSLSLDICKKWSEGKIFQDYKIVILVRLRDPNIQNAKSISELLPYCDEPTAKQIERAIKAIEGRNVLWVLDGWDELPDKLKQEKSLLYDMIYLPNHNSAIVVTSRPVSSVKLHSIAAKRIEVLGFTPEDLKDFFMNRLDDSKAVDTLLDKIKDYPEVESSCYLPLHAAFVADTFMLEKQSFPTTQYSIFESVVKKCISRYQSKLGKEEIQSLDKLKDDVKTNFEAVCELAYQGILENRVIFTKKDLPSGFRPLDLLQEVESMLVYGKDSSKTYNFLHLSIEEFLAAHHLATKKSYEQIWIFKGLMEDKRCLPMLTFYAAKTKLSAFGITDFFSGISEDLLKAENEIKAQNSVASLLFAFKCICEAEHPSVCEPLAKSLNGKYFSSLKIAHLSLLDFYSIGSFLALSSTTDIGSVIKVDFKMSGASDEECKMLMKGMLKCSQNDTKAIVSPLSIDFPSRTIGLDGIDSIATVLKGTMLLHTLEFKSLPLNMCTALLNALQQNSSLHKLEIVLSADISDRNVGCSFEQMLANNSTLQVLNVTGNVGNSIARGLKLNSTLKELTICITGQRTHHPIDKDNKTSRWQIPGKIDYYFPKVARTAQSDLGKSMASKEIDLAPFSTALIVNKSLEILKISSSSGGDTIFYDIACGLEENTALQELDISNCDITAKEGHVLYKALIANNNSLSFLNLSSCRLNTNAVVKIFNGIKQNKTLKELDLSACNVEIRTCKALADALVSNRTLEVLKLNSSRLSDDGAFQLSQGLVRNNTLREFHIKDCGISDIGTNYIFIGILALKLESDYPPYAANHSHLQPELDVGGMILSHKNMCINHFERVVTPEDGPMMIKSISLTILSPHGEYLLMKWLDQGPSIECLHIDCQLYNHQRTHYSRQPCHVDGEQLRMQQLFRSSAEYYQHYQHVDYKQQSEYFDHPSVHYGVHPRHIKYRDQRHFYFNFLKSLKESKSLKILHIDTVHIYDYTWLSLGEFLLENSSLTKLYVNFKINHYTSLEGHRFQRSFAKFVGCLEKNMSLKELKLSSLCLPYSFDRKSIQDRMNISRRKTGQPDLDFTLLD